MNFPLLPALIGFLSFALLLPVSADTKRPYLIMEETTSPDGRYAVAWTLPKEVDMDWDKLRSGDSGREELPDMEEAEIQNFLIDVKLGKKLAPLNSACWSLPARGQSNRATLSVVWSPGSDFVAVLHKLRFYNCSFEVVQLKGGAVVGALSFLQELENAVSRHLPKTYPKQYLRDKDVIVIEFGEVKSLGGGKFSLEASSGQLKRIDDNVLSDDSIVTFELRPGEKQKLQLKVLGFEKVVPIDDDPEAAAKAVAEADKELNAVYQALRSGMNDSERETLKQEQLGWLKQRDQITDDWQRSRFIETRARELKSRVTPEKQC